MQLVQIGLVLLKTEGPIDNVLAVDETLEALREDWFVREVRLLVARTLRRWMWRRWPRFSPPCAVVSVEEAASIMAFWRS